MRIEPIENLQFTQLQPMIDVSLEEGYKLIQRLWDEYDSGENRFDIGGGVLFAAYDVDALVGIGGVHPDPYLDDPTIGRIRHLYVLPEYRRHGWGEKIMQQLIHHSRKTFIVLTLRTLTEHGDKFYKSLGFSDEPRYHNATHWLELSTKT